MALRATLQGIGIGFPMENTVAQHIAGGRLVPLLEGWSAPFPGLFLCYPRQRPMAPALHAFIDAVRAGAPASTA
jgi:DNA-binding transcriptional LysR family regulator